jgi:putative transposase
VREFDYIAVGNVNAAGLAKTRLAKSVLDAGWSSFRGMLRYKALAHGAWYEEVNESFSSRDCSSCQAKTGPKGIAELGIRSWICSECGVSHDRDINSARIILFRSGHRTPAEGIPALF